MTTHMAAGAPGFTNAWLWSNPELSDVTLLLATKGGCGPELQQVGPAAAVQLASGLGGADVRAGLLHTEAKQSVRQAMSRRAQTAASATSAAEPKGKHITAHRQGKCCN
jgi:hypothetical protein